MFFPNLKFYLKIMEDYNFLKQTLNRPQPNRAATKFKSTRDLHSEVDPVATYQRDFNYTKMKKKTEGLKDSFSIEEGEKLIQMWRDNNFADFNSWVQIAKAQIVTDTIDNNSEISLK
jgi:hypothetical protein